MNHSESSRNTALIRKLIVLSVAMFGFGFLLVPLYDVFCDITGIGGKVPNTAAVIVEPQTPDESRTVTLEFVTTLNQQAPWDFRPDVASMEIHPGVFYETTFHARNLTQRTLVGQAVPSIAPGEVARYLKKTECFCFTSQEYGPGEEKDLALRFVIDPDIPKYVDRITLSYTYFVSQKVASRTDAAGI